jgi:hypothetical protein
LSWTFLIHRPPREVMHGSHGACFHDYKTAGTKRIHFNNPPDTLDAGIMSVERTISESFVR